VAGETPEGDDRTEEPTRKRLDEAVKRGDVAKSVEINTLFVLGGFTLALMVLGGQTSRMLALDLRPFLMNAPPRAPSPRRSRAPPRPGAPGGRS